ILSYAERKRASPWQKLAEIAVPQFTAADRAPEPPPLSIAESATPAIELLPPPEVSGQYDTSASVTSVAMFHANPRRYFLERYLGLVEPSDTPGTGAIELGLAVHKVL